MSKRNLKSKTYGTEEDSCPYCGKIFNCASIINEDISPPKKKDFSICIKCGGFLEYGENLRLKKLPLGTYLYLDMNIKSKLLNNYDELVNFKTLLGFKKEITFDIDKFLEGYYE